MTRYSVTHKKLYSVSPCAGFTLTELTFVLLAAGFIIGAIWIAAGHMWDNYRLTRATQQLTKITQNIRQYYMNAQAFPAAAVNVTASLDQKGLFPMEMRRNPGGGAGGPIDHPMNSTIAGGSLYTYSELCSGSTMTVATCFRVRMEGLSQGQCINLLEAVPVNDADLGIVQVGTNNMGAGTKTTSVSIPVSSSTAESWCNNAGNTNEVDWDFRLHN